MNKLYCSCSICELKNAEKEEDFRLLKGLRNALIIIGVIILIIFGFSKLAHADTVDMSKISMIESSNEPLAYNNGHVGEYQLSQGVVVDFNEYNESNGVYSNYFLNDMYIKRKADLVAQWYMNIRIPELLKAYGIPDTTTSRIIAWNLGIGHLRHWFKNGSHWNRLPRETRQYIKKYFLSND